MTTDHTHPYTPDADPAFVECVMRCTTTMITAWSALNLLGQTFQPMLVLVWDDGTMTPTVVANLEDMTKPFTTDEVAGLYANINASGTLDGLADAFDQKKLKGTVLHGRQTILCDSGFVDSLVTVGLELDKPGECAVCCGVKLPIPADIAETEVIPAEEHPIGYEVMVVALETGNQAVKEWQDAR